MPVVVTDIARADRAATDSLAQYGVATVHEAQGRTGLMHPRLRPVYRGPAISGTAVTCTVAPGDNWTIHVAAEQIRDGDILVVSPIATSHSGYFGDLLGTLFGALGARGVVIDAGCRDVDDLEKMGFPVWAREICAHGTVKETVGDVNVPISCGEVVVSPGDAVVADNDGVVIVPRLRAAEVAELSAARIAREEKVRARYGAGELGIDINDMRPRLKEKGLTYIDQASWLANGGKS